MAHVEAPTFGSVILARLLLKLGGVGLIRVSFIFERIKYYVLSYLLVFLVLSTAVCSFQSDLKRLIAYSSVSHIIVIPVLVIGASSLSLKAIALIILFHGLRSSLLFIMVSVVYSQYATRQIAIVRGVIVHSPLFSVLIAVSFLFNISAPPFPSFISEVFTFMSMSDLTEFVYPYVFSFILLSLIYNLN
jgi:NADH-quinone oxidoreductase subunit M